MSVSYEYFTIDFAPKAKTIKFIYPDGHTSSEADTLEEFLVRRGDLGWELISVLPLIWQDSPPGTKSLSLCRLIFKKLKSL